MLGSIIDQSSKINGPLAQPLAQEPDLRSAEDARTHDNAFCYQVHKFCGRRYIGGLRATFPADPVFHSDQVDVGQSGIDKVIWLVVGRRILTEVFLAIVVSHLGTG